MALTQQERVDVLRQAVRLQCRSFIEYIGESAPPYDAVKFPALVEAMREIVADKHAMADQLVEVTRSLDAHADLTVAFNPRFTYFNYMQSDFAIRTLIEHLERELSSAAEMAERAGDDPVVGAILREVVEHERAYLARLQDLVPSIRSTTTETPPVDEPIPTA